MEYKKTAIFEEIKQHLILHCAPVFMGAKPAAIFVIKSKQCLRVLAGLLPKDIKLFVLRKPGRHFLAMLYDEILLKRTIINDSMGALLAEFGYPAGTSIYAALRYLKRQFVHCSFPHEVGLFLGYPAADVLGFMQNKGNNYKLCGYWAVYGDVENAKQCFERYSLCRSRMKTALDSACSSRQHITDALARLRNR